MRHHDEIRGTLEELRGCEAVIVFRTYSHTDLSNRSRDDMRTHVSAKEIAFRPCRNLLPHPAYLVARWRRQHKRVIKVLTARFKKAGTHPDVKSSRSRFQPLD